MRGDLQGRTLPRNREAAAFQRLVLIDFVVSTPALVDVTEPALKARAGTAAIGQGLERTRDQQVCGEAGGRARQALADAVTSFKVIGPHLRSSERVGRFAAAGRAGLRHH